MWLLPTRQRQASLKRFFRACREYSVSTPGLVLVNADEYARDRDLYAAIELPKGWRVHPVEADCMQGALRAAWPLVHDCDWIGLLQDDLVPHTPAWDVKLVSALKGWNVVSAHNGQLMPQHMQGAIAWSGDLARAMASLWGTGLYPAGFNHLYGDDVWEALNVATRCWELIGHVVTHHNNETYLSDNDATAKSVYAHTDHDKARFDDWSNNEKAQALEIIRAVQHAKGVFHYSADLRGLKVMLATPTGDGRIDTNYLDSMFEMVGHFNASGAELVWSKEPRNADIALARARLFGQFLHSGCSHMLMVDDDIGWDWSAIIRVFAARKDFVAVAGPKKFYPLTFACDYSAESGEAIPMRVDPESGAAECHHIGAAFALITRACAEKMSAAYDVDLGYDDAAGQPQVAVFNPFVMNRRYFSEDFAFCKRWRMIGGTVHVCIDVELSHTGAHTFRGALRDHHTKIPDKSGQPAEHPAAEHQAAAD